MRRRRGWARAKHGKSTTFSSKTRTAQCLAALLELEADVPDLVAPLQGRQPAVALDGVDGGLLLGLEVDELRFAGADDVFERQRPITVDAQRERRPVALDL